ncbi:MAG: AMP-binding protein, partial [Proteobacteria bacterium]|nr:AMP-binding protein [Pseudomonadota bacterium]
LAQAHALAATRLPTLRIVLFGGEPIPTRVLVAWMQTFPDKVFYNAYGPTEATGVSMYYRVTRCPDDPGERIPIGIPCENVALYLLDDDRRSVPVGEVGEIALGGPCITRGYRNDVAKTAHVFIDDPWAPGARLYLTGDQARQRADGNYEFLGRKDDQVKVMGYRLELTDIEHALVSIDGVNAAGVLLADATADLAELVAYLEITRGTDLAKVLHELRQRLPFYMLPRRVHEVGDSRPLYDVHVSPYEVIFDAFAYHAEATSPGVYTMSDEPYHAPEVGPLRVVAAPPHRDVPMALSMVMYRKLYAQIGPRVLADHMVHSGIRTSLLIPVVPAGSDGAEQFRLMFELYPTGDGRFAFAYCPPASVPTDELLAEIRRVAARYPLTALKVHPNLQHLDLTSTDGRDRLDVLLVACAATHLPLMVHGGLSTVHAVSGATTYATLDHLMTIDWRRAGVPIILGHAGLFGHAFDDSTALLAKLQRVLSANDNVVVDLSGLGFDTLCKVLGEVDHDRIVFGSDALYFPQWAAVVKLLHALETIGVAAQDTFAKLAGTNAEHALQARCA